MADYSMLGTLSDGGASALSGDLITKLRTADEKAKLSPIETKLENWDKELEKIDEIGLLVSDLQESVKVFDLFGTSNNAFEQITANTSGDAAIFDAVDIGSLKEGIVSINIAQLAQKDVYQTSIFTDKSAVLTSGQGDTDKLSIQIGTGDTYDFATKDKSADDIVASINATVGVTASIEEVGDGEYRIVIKSTESGLNNNLTITETGVDLGINDSDGDGVDDTANHLLVAQNLHATVDGVSYDVSSNSITVDGNLKVTATKEGDSTISIQKDDSYVMPALEDMVLKYNELLDVVNEELYSADSSIEDKGSLRNIMDQFKNILFQTHGEEDIALFNQGFSFDINGKLLIDTKTLGESLTNNFDDIKRLFVGVAEDKGIGTMMKEAIDDMNAYNGILTVYGDHMAETKIELEENKKEAIDDLDTKYSLMASQFAAYGAIISQMEASFGGMKMMIDQSTSSD